jgi:hypothetical protein
VSIILSFLSTFLSYSENVHRTLHTAKNQLSDKYHVGLLGLWHRQNEEVYEMVQNFEVFYTLNILKNKKLKDYQSRTLVLASFSKAYRALTRWSFEKTPAASSLVLESLYPLNCSEKWSSTLNIFLWENPGWIVYEMSKTQSCLVFRFHAFFSTLIYYWQIRRLELHFPQHLILRAQKF